MMDRLDSWDMPERIVNALMLSDIVTVADLISRSRDQLAALPRIGAATIREIEINLREHGLALRADDPVEPDRSALRARCVQLAVETARAGLAFDVLASAERYLAWITTGEVPAAIADDQRPFKQRLIEMFEAELHSERLDMELMRKLASEAFGEVEDRHWPPQVPPMVHNDIRA